MPPSKIDAYGTAWKELEAAVQSAGGQAWRFRSEGGGPGGDVRSIEFIELNHDLASLADSPAIADALTAIEIIAASEIESTWEAWEEWRE